MYMWYRELFDAVDVKREVFFFDKFVICNLNYCNVARTRNHISHD
jgi:hypothetical protein